MIIFLIIWAITILITMFIWKMFVKYIGLTDEVGAIIFLGIITLVPFLNIFVSMLAFFFEFTPSKYDDKYEERQNLIKRFQRVVKKILFVKEKNNV